MDEAAAPEALQLVSLRSMLAEGADWHAHPFHELVMITEDEALIGHQGAWKESSPNTLYLHACQEKHGGIVAPGRQPRFWVVHFRARPRPESLLSQLLMRPPSKRVWTLNQEQAEAWQSLFFQIIRERSQVRAGAEEAVASWLQLLVIQVARLGKNDEQDGLSTAKKLRPDVVKLWHRIQLAVHQSQEESDAIFSAPNYDSLRHAFRQAYGCSPRDLLIRLRVEAAKNMLLESHLSVKEISARLGYARQHDFYRVFHREVRCSPTEWRQNPGRVDP